MEGFLPCCPFDCQTLMDSDVQIDDLLQMEKELLVSEDKINFPTEGIDDIGHKISDYCLANLSSTEHEKSTSEVIIKNSKNFYLEDTLEKYITLTDTPSTSLIDTDSKNDIINTNSEDPSQISSVSKAFIINIFEQSNGIESFQDLNSFLKQDSGSVNNCSSKDNSSNLLNKEVSTMKNLQISSTVNDSGIKQCQSRLQSDASSNLLFAENECYEPHNKLAKLEYPSTSKNEKYYEMRRKNNMSSRRSRLTKKQRERELEEKEKYLIQENEKLRKQEKQLELLVQKVKNILFSSVKRKN